MEQENKLAWEALEFEEKERGSDWFWAIGIIFAAGSIASAIWGNYFFAALLVISGILLTFFAKQPPRTIYYELNELGLKIGDQLYPYENIKSYYVETEGRPTLFVKSERVFMPIIGIPIHEEFADEITLTMQHFNVGEEKMSEHPSEKIMEFFGF